MQGIILLLAILALCIFAFYNPRTPNEESRRLWSDHVIYTRLYIISRLSGDTQKADAYAQRLMKNQEDIGNQFAKRYGKTVSEKVTSLLKEHILGAATIITDVLSQNDTKESVNKWRANAEEIAAAIASLNSEWPLETNRNMLKMHLDRTLDEVALIRDSDPKDISNFDDIMNDMLGFADYLSKGL
jgi:hypothetical protein